MAFIANPPVAGSTPGDASEDGQALGKGKEDVMARSSKSRCVAVKIAAGVALVLAAPSVASAQTRRLDDGPVTPRMMALGGRAEAISSSTSAMFACPAAMVATRSYHGDAYALYDPTAGRISLGSALVDSTRSLVAAGLSYVWNNVDTPGEQRRTHDTRLVLALPIGTVFGLGGTVRFLDLNAGPPVANETSTLRPSAWTGFTFDAGAFLRPAQFVQFTVTGYNLNNPDTTAAPISLGFGAAVIPIPQLTIVADGLIDFRTMGTPRGRYSGGVEVFLANHVPLRAGYVYDHVRDGAQAITAGLGYLDENFGVEFSMRQGIVPEPQTTLMLSLRFFYRPQQ